MNEISRQHLNVITLCTYCIFANFIEIELRGRFYRCYEDFWKFILLEIREYIENSNRASERIRRLHPSRFFTTLSTKLWKASCNVLFLEIEIQTGPGNESQLKLIRLMVFRSMNRYRRAPNHRYLYRRHLNSPFPSEVANIYQYGYIAKYFQTLGGGCVVGPWKGRIKTFRSKCKTFVYNYYASNVHRAYART